MPRDGYSLCIPSYILLTHPQTDCFNLRPPTTAQAFSPKDYALLRPIILEFEKEEHHQRLLLGPVCLFQFLQVFYGRIFQIFRLLGLQQEALDKVKSFLQIIDTLVFRPYAAQQGSDTTTSSDTTASSEDLRLFKYIWQLSTLKLLLDSITHQQPP